MGGGNKPKACFRRAPKGLSPRGRGKLTDVYLRCQERGSIPAWAGETFTHVGVWGIRQVYPRVGGGNSIRRLRFAGVRGLSPRGRGKRLLSRRPFQPRRSIPAWAGETTRTARHRRRRMVYPRVGGGNPKRFVLQVKSVGLSPRGRGKLLHFALLLLGLRSIPAWAGETIRGLSKCRCTRVYPRVGGGNAGDAKKWRLPRGLSPRGRGKPAQGTRAVRQLRSIPAWAGETVAVEAFYFEIKVYPRVGGGNNPPAVRARRRRGLSPRGRGKP